MPVSVPLPPLLLLWHEGGWDELIMVAVGLAMAYFVIVWTGRRSHDPDDELEETDEVNDEPAAIPDERSSRVN